MSVKRQPTSHGRVLPEPSPETIVWLLCEACGHWERGQKPCAACGWHRTRPIAPSEAQAGSALRFLLETEVRSDKSWHVSAVRSARIADLALDYGLLRALKDESGPLRHLVDASKTTNGSLPAIGAFERFRDEATGIFQEMLQERVSRAWPAPGEPSSATAVASVRCLVLDPAINDSKDEVDWLHVVPFDTAAAEAAAMLKDSDVALVSNRTIGMGDDGALLSVTLTAPRELLVEGCAIECEVEGKSRLLWRSEYVAAAYREVPLTLPSFRLPAEAVRGLAMSAHAESAKVQVTVRGRKEPFRQDLAFGSLPSSQRIVDLLLDLGSTTTKWALRFRDDGVIEEHDQDTDSLVRAWGIPPYRKSELVADASGRLWREWLARAIPALRTWVGHEHKAFLGDIKVSLPATKRFDVDRLAKAVRSEKMDGSKGLFSEIMRRLFDLSRRPGTDPLTLALREHLVDDGTVHLAPEHVFLARHYLDVLRVLRDAATAYSSRFESREARRAAQASRRASWDSQKSALKKHNKKFFIARWLSKKPKGPSGSRPTISRSLTDPEAWMSDLIERPEQLDRVLLLDAGGLSLDVAVLEGQKLVRELSHSFDGCGGEELSRQIGRNQTGPRGTRHKAQLALRWRDAPNPRDRQQREYIDTTRSLYGPELTPLLRELGTRWSRARASVVLLTGGGSRNPHLRDLVGELAAEAGLHPTVADAPYIQEMLRQARSFAEPLPELESSTIRRFEETQTWSERRERQPWARYDKFAVVGGMLVQGEGGA
jgi:hypothetical protein